MKLTVPMKFFNCIGWILGGMLSVMVACSDDEPQIPAPSPEPETPVIRDGFNFDPVFPEADMPLTITFKAPSGSTFYGHTGDLYLHSGVGVKWEGAPVWGDNQAKYKLTRIKRNQWSITLPVSVRDFYGFPESELLQTLNLILRDANGGKQTSDFATLVDDTRNGFVRQPAKTEPMPLLEGDKAGIHVNSASSVTWVLHDEDTQGAHKDDVFIVGDFNRWTLDNDYRMKYDSDNRCWWITLDALPAGETHFQYFVYDKQCGGSYLCDPYCEKALEKNVDAAYPSEAAAPYVSVVNTTPQPYVWKNENFEMGNLESPVIYELLLRDFSDTGDLAGATEKLPYLKELGVDAIELMPVQEFAGNDSWGYNTGLYFALDGSYGTADEYKAFVDACHGYGIAVIFDVVYNHTNNDNPFSRMYWDSFRNRPAENNPWLNSETPHSQYVFSPDDFNHSSALTRSFVKRNLKYLLETYRIDGFRFDFTKGFTQKKTSGDSDLMVTDPERVAVLKEYYNAVKAVKSDAIVIMEHFCADEERTLAADGVCFWRNMNGAYCQSAMGWKDKCDFSGLYDSVYPDKFVGYMESHDEERCAYKQIAFGNGVLKSNLEQRIKQLSSNAAFFLTVPGPKMIWQFGEMGYDVSIEKNGRTGRKPLHWEYQTTRKALVDTYTQLIGLRAEHPELFKPSAQLTWRVNYTADWDNGYTLLLEAVNGKKLYAYANFTAAPMEHVLPDGTWHEYLEGGTSTAGGVSVSVPAHEFRLYTNFANE